MAQKLVPRRIITLLVAGILVLPVVIAVIWGVSSILGAMNDETGEAVLRGVGLGLGILWIVNLILLLLAQAVNSLSDSEEAD